MCSSDLHPCRDRVVPRIRGRAPERRGQFVLSAHARHDAPVRILVTAVFERIVYHCACVDPNDPGRPVLEVDAILRPGDADGPLLLPMAELKRMLGFTRAQAHIEEFRAQGRTEVRDGVEYLAFPVWKDLGRP